MAFASGTKGGIQVGYVAYIPRAAAAVPNGAMFLDSAASNAPTVKGTGGSSTAIGATSSADILVKSMQNKSGVTIAANTMVAKKTDGSIVAADSDGVGTQVVVGIATAAILDNATGNVSLIGPNVVGAIAGLGFAPGDAIYLGETGGYINDLAQLTGSNDSIIRVGYADCAAGAASATATDLIMFAEVLARP